MTPVRTKSILARALGLFSYEAGTIDGYELGIAVGKSYSIGFNQVTCRPSTTPSDDEARVEG